jgi:spoIIIJ-associated protein
MASDLPTDMGASESRHFEEPSEERVSPTPAPYAASESGEPTVFASAPDDFDPPARSFEPRSEAPREHRSEGPRESREPREPRSAPALSGDELAATSRKVTEDLFQAMGFVGKVTATLSGPDKVEVVVEVSDDEELLTGRKGETRQALQHLLNRMVNKGEGSRYHLQLEINDFWKHREEELAEQARGMAERAVQSGQEQVTDFLNAQERRIIHVTLREDGRVKTYALGDGMIKRLAVAPAHAETMGGSES